MLQKMPFIMLLLPMATATLSTQHTERISNLPQGTLLMLQKALQTGGLVRPFTSDHIGFDN